MDKIKKFLKKLNKKEQEVFYLLMLQLNKDYSKIPNLKPLRDKKNYFRIRLGRYRLIFKVDKVQRQIEIKKITKRDDRTYKDF